VDNNRVVRSFDPLFYGHPNHLPVGTPFPAEKGLDWSDSPTSAALTLLATVAGTREVHPNWLNLPNVRFWGHLF
jgi:hypothetical protein